MITLHNVYDEDRIKGKNVFPFTFPGGEPHVNVNRSEIEDQYIWIDARVGDAETFMRLLAVIDAVKACRPKRLGLHIPYFPGARQDRRQPGTPFTLKIYSEILKRCDLNVIVTFDPHSEVLPACIDVEVVPLHTVIPNLTHDAWICPDAGAEKRVLTAAKEKNQNTVVFGRKKRDVLTGGLSGFSCEPLPVTPGKYLIVDDICDGGGTFIGLSKILPAGNSVDLWVSHGIFSKGQDALLTEFRTIYTTDSFPFTVNSPRVVVTELHPHAARIMRDRISK